MRRVAVTGFGVVSAIGIGREAFWDALASGKTGIAPITRFCADTFDVRLAAEVKDPTSLSYSDTFLVNARFGGLNGLPPALAGFSMTGFSPESAKANSGLSFAIDPKITFAHAACAEALTHAGIDRFTPTDLLHLGTSLESFDLAKLVSGGCADFTGVVGKFLNPSAPPLQIPLDTANRFIMKAFGAPGRSLVNCSACAAGAQAIGHGFQSIRSGRFERAICGGFDSMINPLGVGGFQLLGALTTDNERGEHACRPFDAARAGTVLGEGAAVVVLEPFDKARAEGKPILAEVCGYGSSLDAHNLSAPDPDGDGAARAMFSALSDANLPAETIAHINAHGTGTQLNDEVEARAIRRVFANNWQSIPVSATKSMTGHCIAAAGAVEFGACLLALVRGALPPNPSLEKVAPGCELDHVAVPGRTLAGDYVLTNSFGFGGQNAALVLRKA